MKTPAADSGLAHSTSFRLEAKMREPTETKAAAETQYEENNSNKGLRKAEMMNNMPVI